MKDLRYLRIHGSLFDWLIHFISITYQGGLFQYQNGVRTVVGVVAFGPTNEEGTFEYQLYKCIKTLPSMFANVKFYMPWINKYLNGAADKN